MDTKMEAIITRMEKSRQQLDAALEKIAPQEDIYPTWKVKQVMDHITGWDELVYVTLQSYSQGGDLPIRMTKGIDAYNAESVSARKDIPLDQSRRNYQEARARVLRLLRELPAEMFDKEYPAPWGGKCTISGVMKIFVSHEREHARHIEDVLSKSA